MKIKIHVTENEIKNGECKEPGLCAIALAVKDVFGWVSVSTDHFSIYTDGLVVITLPKEAKDFIRSFDHGERVTPISFEIEVPEKVIDYIGISEVERILSESKTLERV